MYKGSPQLLGIFFQFTVSQQHSCNAEGYMEALYGIFWAYNKMPEHLKKKRTGIPGASDFGIEG